VLGTITTTGKTIRLDEITSHADSVGFPEHHPEMDSFLGVPVRVGERVFGNLYLTDKPGGFSEDDEILVEFLAITAGSAVSTLGLQERLRRAALLEDRERIARDLHDSIIQDLFAVGLSLQSASGRVASHPTEVAARIEEAVEQLDETIGALRRFIFDLRPPMWARPSLRRELADLVGQLSAPYDARVSLDVNCPADLLPPDLSDELVQIVKEALSNSLRHSGASEIGVRVGCGRSQVVLSVSDDGSGFDPARKTKGMGLANMAERVRDAGGSIRVDSEPGAGTTVRVSIPIA
jgi:signal transduction histidine kinase